MIVIENPSRENWATLAQRPQVELNFLDSSVRNILARVKKSGDEALRELTLQFDKTVIQNFEVPIEEIRLAQSRITTSLSDAILQAASNIECFHRQQQREVQMVETMPGVHCWRKAVPIKSVGLYIPGGTAPLFSTVLMLAIPAKLAGCEDIVLCTPPDKEGNINPAILFAAAITGITRIFKAGGAQAIAAMAYGTETIPKVSKIFGPGNQYVTKAKQLVTEDSVAIDMPAGPSEVLIWIDETATASFVAADLLSQAEHGEDSQVLLVTSNKDLCHAVNEEITKQLDLLPRKAIAEKALQNSRAIVMNDPDMAIDFINAFAPEHLIINTANADSVADRIQNAGSVFIGNYTPESVGDYASGTNHTLPTNGYAKAYSGVSLESFQKYITFQKLTTGGLHKIGPVVETMAEAENLIGHKMAVRIRLEQLSKEKL